MTNEYQKACLIEQQRLQIAKKWADFHRSPYSKQFDRGREDRVAGRPCRSANGAYLDGWYSL